MSRIPNLNENLNDEFYHSLGEIKTLIYLDISHSGKLAGKNVEMFARAIAMNKYKNGCLTNINMEECFKN